MTAKHFTSDTFETDVAGSKGDVLVDFWSPTCGPCVSLAPIIDELAEDLSGKAVVGKVDVSEQRSLATRFHVMSIPTVILFKDGKESKRMVGLRPKHELAAMLE